jgi:hypothetical protein
MNDYKVNIENLLLSYYIKYERLLPMCNSALADIQGDTVDVYIDIYDLLKKIYTTEIYAKNKFSIVSLIINLAGHIRGYFRSRHRLHTRIYLVYGESISDQHKLYYPAFGDDKFKTNLLYEKNKDFIESQLKLVQILCGYIYDVYYIPKKSDFSMFVYDNIIKNPPNRSSIIITKSKYAYQIPALCHQTKIFRPKKSKGEDMSYIVEFRYVYGNLFNKISQKTTIERLSKISPKMCSLIMSLTGLPSYGVINLLNISSASKMIIEAIESGKLINDYNGDVKYIYSVLDGLQSRTDYITFECRFKAIDLVNQHRIYSSTAEANDISWFINLNDPETVKNINNKYFIDNPLDLNSL